MAPMMNDENKAEAQAESKPESEATALAEAVTPEASAAEPVNADAPEAPSGPVEVRVQGRVRPRRKSKAPKKKCQNAETTTNTASTVRKNSKSKGVVGKTTGQIPEKLPQKRKTETEKKDTSEPPNKRRRRNEETQADEGRNVEVNAGNHFTLISEPNSSMPLMRKHFLDPLNNFFGAIDTPNDQQSGNVESSSINIIVLQRNVNPAGIPGSTTSGNERMENADQNGGGETNEEANANDEPLEEEEDDEYPENNKKGSCVFL